MASREAIDDAVLRVKKSEGWGGWGDGGVNREKNTGDKRRSPVLWQEDKLSRGVGNLKQGEEGGEKGR